MSYLAFVYHKEIIKLFRLNGNIQVKYEFRYDAAPALVSLELKMLI